MNKCSGKSGAVKSHKGIQNNSGQHTTTATYGLAGKRKRSKIKLSARVCCETQGTHAPVETKGILGMPKCTRTVSSFRGIFSSLRENISSVPVGGPGYSHGASRFIAELSPISVSQGKVNLLGLGYRAVRSLQKRAVSHFRASWRSGGMTCTLFFLIFVHLRKQSYKIRNRLRGS